MLLGFVLILAMLAALAVTAYAASVTVKYRVYVYTDEITFRQYDYSQSTTPSITNLTISATSSLGSGSALYHMKYADGAVAYCIEPGVHSDDSGTYKEGSSASWYNLPASVQSGIALAMSLGYPSADYGTASGDRNSSAIINAEKWAATQAVIWELICEYRNAYTYDDWEYSPFYGCVDTSRYPTFGLWYDKIAIDIIKSEANEEYSIGGTAANVASILSQLGLKVSLLIPQYNDLYCDLLFEQLRLRKIDAIVFGKSKFSTPRIIEHCNDGKHIFETRCSKCGKILTKLTLPSPANIQKIGGDAWQDLGAFFFDRISDGIRVGIQRAHTSRAWVYYEPNCCRQFSTFCNNVAQADIAKFSAEAIPQSYIAKLSSELSKQSETKLLIVSEGSAGLKYALKTASGDFEKWVHLDPSTISNIADTSGAGDWLTASFLWFLLNKYPKVQSELHTNVIRQLLADAQDVAAQSCLYLGAQGIFSSAEGTSFLKNRFNRDIRLLPKFVLGPCHESLCKNCRSYLL